VTTVEVLLLSERDGVLHYRAQRAPLPPDWHPDDLAFCLAGMAMCDRTALLHSTSWRYEDGAVVLTFNTELASLSAEDFVERILVDRLRVTGAANAR